MSDLILALETSSDVCGVAIQRDGRLVTEYAFRHSMHLSERLIEITDRVLRDADAELKDVTAFAVGIGPGSFTGTRIGVMTAKTWASVLQKPIIGISSLEALAAEYSGIAATVIPLLPCRKGVVYACPFDVSGEIPQPMEEPISTEIARLNVYADRINLFCGVAAAQYRDEIKAAFVGQESRLWFGKAESPRAAQIARLARIRLAAHEICEDALTLVPLYISPPPISLPKQAFATPIAPEGE